MTSETRPVDDERVYRVLMANTQDAVFIVSLNFDVLRVNERAMAMFGFTGSELTGQSLTHVLPNAEHDLLQRMQAGEVIPLFERTMHRRDGTSFAGEVNLSLVPDENDQPLCFLAIIRDVSERSARLNELNESQRLFDGIADMLPGIIHILDIVENRTVYVNRELVELLGYPTNVPDGVATRLQTVLIHPDDRAQIAQDYARLRVAADHEVVEGEYRVQTADGRWRWLYSRSSVFKRDENGVPRQIVSVLIDIDDRKREAERHEAEQERTRLVNDIATATATAMTDDQFARHVVSILHRRYPQLRVVLAELEGNALAVRASAQPDGIMSLAGLQMPLDPRPEFRAILNQFQPLVVQDVTVPDALPVPKLTGIRAMLSAPLRRADSLIGLLSLHSPEPRVWEQQEIETLRECAAYVSAALASAEQRREREKTEAALRESERLYRTLIDHFPDGAVLLFDHDMRYVVAGGTALTQVGLTRDRLEGRTVLEVFNRPDEQALLEPFYRRALAGESFSFDADWKGHSYTTHLLPVFDDQGTIIAGLSVIADVTERRLAEHARELSEERYRQVVEDQTELICRFVAGGELTFVNEAYCRYFGVRREDVIGQSFLPHVFDEDRARIEAVLASMGADNQVTNTTQRSITVNGNARWQAWNNRVILDAEGNVVEYQGVGRDITDQLKIEEALAEKTHLLQTVIDSLPDFIYVKDREGHVLLDNIAHARSLNAVPADIVGKTDYDLFPFDLADGYTRDDRGVMENGIPLINREEISISTEGERVWAVTSKVPFRNSRGEIIGLIGQTHDISKRKSAEDELQRERDFTQTILDTTAALMIVVDTDGRILSFNRACEQLSGYSADEVKGLPFWDIYILPEEYDRVRAAFAQLETGAPMNHNVNYWCVRDGRRILLEWINTAVRRADGSIQFIISSGIDITERKQLEERNLELAVERERIRFLNDFVRNISHDLRTPLSVLNTSLYLMRKVNDPARQLERIDTMKEQVDRLTRLIEQLMTMSRLDSPDARDYQSTDLCELTRTTARLFERAASQRSLALDAQPYAGTLAVLADDTQLTIAFSSLLENELQYARTRVGLRLFSESGMAVVEFSDDGPGIPAHEIAQIFDRFYRGDKARSTETGGTGLGLSMAKKIIDNHGGQIVVETQLGQGSLFRVTLPLAPSIATGG